MGNTMWLLGGTVEVRTRVACKQGVMSLHTWLAHGQACLTHLINLRLF